MKRSLFSGFFYEKWIIAHNQGQQTVAQSEHEQQQSLLQDCRESWNELLFYEFKAFCLKRIQPSEIHKDMY